jgi:hypothetical protein
LSPVGQKKDPYSNRQIQQQPVSNVPKAGMNLPPRPARKTEKTEESTARDPGARLRRVGE